MFDRTQIEALAQNLYESLPISLQNSKQEIQQQFKEILQAAFNHMELVTREEFDVQVKVLARTREKVDALQAQLDKLETVKK